ncbi:MAG TPA: acyl carrier protein [Clostridiales bacterium]|nr:acyl carrier protein [Clostridiales bacterium]
MYEKICALLAEKFDVDVATLNENTSIKDDLQADSLDIVELMTDLEDEYNITIEDEEVMQMSTIGDVVKYIEAHT